MTRQPLQESCSRSWFVAVESQTGETLDVADLRSGPIGGIEHVEVVPRSEAEALAEALEDIATRPTVERNPDGDDQAAWTMQLIARGSLDIYRRDHPKETS